MNDFIRNLPRAPNREYIGSSAGGYLKLLILDKRDDAIQTLRNYKQREARGIIASTHKVKARVYGLYLEICSSLKRSMEATEYKKLKEQIASNKISDLEDAFMTISDFLDSKRITRFDSKVNVEGMDAEEENEVDGFD